MLIRGNKVSFFHPGNTAVIARRFYARDVKVVSTYLTSEMLESTGVKTSSIRVDYNIVKNIGFCKNSKTLPDFPVVS